MLSTLLVQLNAAIAFIKLGGSGTDSIIVKKIGRSSD